MILWWSTVRAACEYKSNRSLHKRDRGHHCTVRGSKQGIYAENSFDFLAVYLISLDQWYIIPTAQVGGQKTFSSVLT